MWGTFYGDNLIFVLAIYNREKLYKGLRRIGSYRVVLSLNR